jgi:hypothetical protein
LRGDGGRLPSIATALFALIGVAGGCSDAHPPAASTVAAPVARHTEAPAPAAADSLSTRFDALAPGRGLSLSLDVVGDADGETTFRIAGCCGIDAADRFAEDVRFVVDGQPLPARREGPGWTVRHAPRAPVTVR